MGMSSYLLNQQFSIHDHHFAGSISSFQLAQTTGCIDSLCRSHHQLETGRLPPRRLESVGLGSWRSLAAFQSIQSRDMIPERRQKLATDHLLDLLHHALILERILILADAVLLALLQSGKRR